MVNLQTYRLGRHTADLETNRHDCDELQNDFNMYGKAFFKFESLELNMTSLQKRLKKEKDMIQKQEHCYNRETQKTWNAYSQKVKIKNQIYSSLRQASEQTGESRTQLTRKCKKSEIVDYVFLEKYKTTKK